MAGLTHRHGRPLALSEEVDDDMVADLLAQFNAHTQPSAITNNKAPIDQPQSVEDTQPPSEMATTPPTSIPLDRAESESRLVSIELPQIPNLDEYEYLPGHFDVQRVLRETSDGGKFSYRVELRSGEIETVSSSRLHSLNNGLKSLERFRDLGSEPVDLEDSEPHRLRKRRSHNYHYRDSSPDSSRSLSRSRSHATDEDEYELLHSDLTKRRSARPRRRRFIDSFVVANDDEMAEESSASSDDVIASSGTTSRRRRLRRGARAKVSMSNTNSEDAGPKGTRFSTRHRRTLRKDLRERYEDEISEHEVVKEKKFYGAKEQFHKTPLDDPFRLQHRTICDACGIEGDDALKGALVFCQGCTVAFHPACLGPRSSRAHLVTKISDDHFILQCRYCIGAANAKNPLYPHLGHCTDCKSLAPLSKPLRERLTPREEQQLRQDNGGKDPITSVNVEQVNNIKNMLFRCSHCNRAFHPEHLPARIDSEATEITDDLAALRFSEYSFGWRCYDCDTAPAEIGTIVAWRPIDPKFSSDYAADALEEDDKEYLIRWKGKSYYRTEWKHGTWVWGVAPHAMRNAFFKSSKNLLPNMTAEDAVPEEYLRVDIVFDVEYSDYRQSKRVLKQDLEGVNRVSSALVKFKGLPYEETAWEAPPDPTREPERWSDFKAAYEDWVQREYIHTPDQGTLKKQLALVRKKDFEKSLVRDAQPEIMTGGSLMEYQKDGFNWLYYMWFKMQNAILADEMGLGKTIQVIALFATLIQDHKCWPFLVVVPNSTCPNWRKEIKRWAPSIRAVTYYGSSTARSLAQEYEMFSGGGSDLRCHVIITSYEAMVDSTSLNVLSKIPWAGLVVDEGQRLKNDKSLLYGALRKMKFPFKLLLTGTPLQNNIRELFNLLQFCDPSKNAERLEEEYDVLSTENIKELHDMIRPFFLRRTKVQVLSKELPPMVQIIIPVSMSIVQKKLYKSILAKNPQLINAIFQKSEALARSERHNLNNILMQLRKCLCHPFMYSRSIEEDTPNAATQHRQLVDAGGKLKLLELMLPKLHQRGHRVLIFSQFLENLDIVEDFLGGMGLNYCRLDGRMSSLQKQKQIDDYNAPGSPYFAFLLSTRSGGVGINLATADTVIIMDPDFNPHQDIQALSRAHRIGQENKVLVFKLVTRASAEEKIMQIGKKKMVLDHVLIERMDAVEDLEDLESILRHGAKALFDDDDSGDIHYDSESVDKLLDRSQKEQAASPDDKQENQFSFARVWQNDNSNLGGQLEDTEDSSATPDATVWEQILKERERAAAEEARLKAQTFGRGKRKRATVSYIQADGDQADTVNVTPEKVRREQPGSDTEFKNDVAMNSESDSDSTPGEPFDLDLEPAMKKTKVQPFERVEPVVDPMVSYDGAYDSGAYKLDHVRPPCLACKMDHPLGHCPLKRAGVEHCGLCGLAHFGHSRTCSHLRSEAQVAMMLDALKRSNEPEALVKEAKRYLGGIRGSLAQTRRRQASLAASTASAVSGGSNGTPAYANSGSSSANKYPSMAPSKPPAVDLTHSGESGPVPSSMYQPQRTSQPGALFIPTQYSQGHPSQGI